MNYLSFINNVKSDKFIDKSDCFELIWKHKYITLENCSRTGSSTFLKSLACFLDESINSKVIFESQKIGSIDGFEREVNAYCVLWLDFSDFKSSSFEDAIEYLKDKMSATYKYYYQYLEPETDRYYDYISLEQTLDVIEKKISNNELQHSLSRLAYSLNNHKYRQKGFKLAILIDNLVVLEDVANKEGYGEEMKEFLKRFIVEDVYNCCDFFVQIGNSKEEYDSWIFRPHYITYHYFGLPVFDLRERFPEIIVEPDKQFPYPFKNDTPKECDWSIRIEEGRKKIANAKSEEEIRRHEKICHEKRRFAEELLPGIPHFSNNLGIRKKHLDKTSRPYIKLTTLLREIYKNAYPKFEINEIYRLLMKLDEKERIIKNIQKFEANLEKLTEGMPNWKKPNVNIGDWVQVIYSRVQDNYWDSPAKPGNIKVYACYKTSDIQGFFIDSLKYLLANANNTFAAKIACYNRSDQMCYWLSLSDFKHLENFFQPYFNDMTESMPFVAYKGKLGISKDFPGGDNSHNSMQAHIISDYLKTVSVVDDVDLEAMYNNYIAKWNADIYEESNFIGFKNCSALSFVVIMDTLDIILGESQLNKTSFLLSDNSKFWQILSRSRCWADITL